MKRHHTFMNTHLRNIGIIAHIDAGKTTFSERILFYSDVIHRMGEVHEGAATMDFMPEEQERGITIASACVTCLWDGHTINLVDTPGHVDFTVEVERCLRVLDAAVGIFCGVSGVEPQSETVWKQADGFGIPRLAVVNKLDRAGASFTATLDAMRERLGITPVALTIPLGEGEDFSGVLDIIRQERILFDSETMGRTLHRIPFTEEDALLAAPWREALLDRLTEEDDALLELCLGGEEPTVEHLERIVRAATIARHFVPVFAASALRNIGVQPVLDGVCRYLPGPLELPPVAAHGVSPQNKAVRAESLEEEFFLVAPDPKAPVCALAFKVLVSRGHKTVFLRLYAGTLRTGDVLTNVATGKTERVQHLYRLFAEQREELAEAEAGDIIAVVGMKEAQTGDTLMNGNAHFLLEPLRTWHPVISLALEPKNAEDAELLDEALRVFSMEDPTLTIEQQDGSGQRVVSGMGELHLDVVVERMKREYGITPRTGNPQIVCRETIEKAAEGVGEFDRSLGEQPHYGHVTIAVQPQERGQGISVQFTPELLMPEAAWAEPLREAVEQGIHDACSAGASGHPLDDVLVTITGMSRKNNFVTVPGMHMAAQQAVRIALEKGKQQLLEPLMQITITVPNEHLGAVISLLGTCGAHVENILDKTGTMHVHAVAPMRKLFGFATSLRSVSQGRAGVLMQFLRFDAL